MTGAEARASVLPQSPIPSFLIDSTDLISSLCYAMIAWHYTTGEKFERIARSRELRPPSVSFNPPERPILWFSLNQFWEQTANNAYRQDDGTIVELDMQATLEIGRGLVRVGVMATDSRLHRWPELGEKARMSEAVVEQLIRTGVEKGSNPEDWAGMFTSVRLAECVIDVIDAPTLKWVRIQ
jgi:hypothetical protein